MGRAYHPSLGGDIARYDPRTDTLERLKQTIDGKPPRKETRLALTPNPDPINWDMTPDGKTLYAQPMTGKSLYAYDLTAKGTTLAGRRVGTLVSGATGTDCRAMCVGPTGDVWVAVTAADPKVGRLLHLVSYRAGEKAPFDHGPVAIRNPNFTKFKDKNGKPLPFHLGFIKLEDGTTTTRYVTMGVCQSKDGTVYILALHPYSVLQIPNPRRR